MQFLNQYHTLCVRCGKQAIPGQSICASCLRELNELKQLRESHPRRPLWKQIIDEIRKKRDVGAS